MTITQIVFVLFILLVAFIYIRRINLSRSMKHYTPAELAARLKERSDIVLLDVRSRGERQQSQIKGSVHIPLSEISTRSKELERFKQHEIVCYCQSGSRSMVAAAKLMHDGFNAANLKGGIAEWNYHQL